MRPSPKIRVELVKFTVTGIGANIVNYLAYIFIFNLGASLLIAALAGYLSGLTIAYQLGRSWVFEGSNEISPKKIGLFVLIYGIGALGMIAIIEILVNLKNVDYRVSWLVGAAFAATNNFIGSKLFVFKRIN